MSLRNSHFNFWRKNQLGLDYVKYSLLQILMMLSRWKIPQTDSLICSDIVWCAVLRIITATAEHSDLKHFSKNLFLTARKLLIIPGRRPPKTSICQNGTLKNLLNLFAFQVVLTADKNGNFLIRNQSSCSSGGWRWWLELFVFTLQDMAGGVQTVPSDRGYIDSKFAKTDQETLVVSLILMILA